MTDSPKAPGLDFAGLLSKFGDACAKMTVCSRGELATIFAEREAARSALLARFEAMRVALEPVAKHADEYDHTYWNSYPITLFDLTIGDLRRARTALSQART